MSLDCLAEADTAVKDQTHPLGDRPLVDVTVGNQPPGPLATKYVEPQAKMTQVVDSVGSKSKLSSIRLHAILAIENSYKYS